MPDHPWKALERAAARLLEGRRFPANSGGALDAAGPDLVAQVKQRRRLSLGEMVAALEMACAAAPAGRVGCMVLKLRRGRGQPSPMLLVLRGQDLSFLRARWRGQAAAQAQGHAA